ncbi:hypothetical protein L9F63_001075, partial [Diploptera punctata]
LHQFGVRNTTTTAFLDVYSCNISILVSGVAWTQPHSFKYIPVIFASLSLVLSAFLDVYSLYSSAFLDVYSCNISYIP